MVEGKDLVKQFNTKFADYNLGFKAGKRVGAKEAYEKVIDYIKHPQGKSFFIQEFIEERLKSLEEKGKEK